MIRSNSKTSNTAYKKLDISRNLSRYVFSSISTLYKKLKNIPAIRLGTSLSRALFTLTHWGFN